MKTCLAFVAARSAGHIVPALSLIARAKKDVNDIEIIFFAHKNALDQEILNNSPLINHLFFLQLDNVPSRLWGYIPYCYHVITAFFTALIKLYFYKPQKIISMGGYLSLPVCLAAKVLGIAIEVYELNAIPGKATRRIAYLATHIKCVFEHAFTYFPLHKVSLQPYPLLIPESVQSSLPHTVHFDRAGKTVLVLGGSQGSIFINNLILNYLKTHPCRIQIIHQTGAQDFKRCQTFYQALPIVHHVFPYEKNIYPYYQMADFIIARAGAGTLFEIIHFGKKALIIPLETNTNDHQLYNAQEMGHRYPHLITVLRQQDIHENINFDYFFNYSGQPSGFFPNPKI